MRYPPLPLLLKITLSIGVLFNFTSLRFTIRLIQLYTPPAPFLGVPELSDRPINSRRPPKYACLTVVT